MRRVIPMFRDVEGKVQRTSFLIGSPLCRFLAQHDSNQPTARPLTPLSPPVPPTPPFVTPPSGTGFRENVTILTAVVGAVATVGGLAYTLYQGRRERLAEERVRLAEERVNNEPGVVASKIVEGKFGARLREDEFYLPNYVSTQPLMEPGRLKSRGIMAIQGMKGGGKTKILEHFQQELERLKIPSKSIVYLEYPRNKPVELVDLLFDTLHDRTIPRPCEPKDKISFLQAVINAIPNVPDDEPKLYVLVDVIGAPIRGEMGVGRVEQLIQDSRKFLNDACVILCTSDGALSSLEHETRVKTIFTVQEMNEDNAFAFASKYAQHLNKKLPDRNEAMPFINGRERTPWNCILFAERTPAENRKAVEQFEAKVETAYQQFFNACPRQEKRFRETVCKGEPFKMLTVTNDKNGCGMSQEVFLREFVHNRNLFTPVGSEMFAPQSEAHKAILKRLPE